MAISRRRRYDTLVSLDDDILLAPPAYLALLQHAPFGVRGADLCRKHPKHKASDS